MKNWRFLVFGFLIFGCSQDRIPKPEPFMEEHQMVDFLIDLSLANASRSYSDVPIVLIDSLYSFHGIDSVTFAKNNLYYVSKPKQYTKIFEEVQEHIDGLIKQDSTTLRLPALLIE